MVDKHWKLQLRSTLASTFAISSDEESIDDPSWQQIVMNYFNWMVELQTIMLCWKA